MKKLLSFKRKIRVFTFVAIIMLITASIPLSHPDKAYSAPVTITNFNFEDPFNGEKVINYGAVPGWVKSGGGTYGTYNPTPLLGGWWYTSSDFIDSGVTGGESGTMKGPNVAFFWVSPGASMTQTLTETLQVGTQYTLSALTLGIEPVSSTTAIYKSLMTDL